MKKGFTLLELIIAMGIFSVMASIAVGAFVMTLNLKALSGNVRDSNQKVRYAIDYISRYGRQAEKVITSDNNCGSGSDPCIVDMYFNIGTPHIYAERFFLDIDTSTPELSALKRYECQSSDIVNEICSGWTPTNGVDMLSGNVRLEPGSYFQVTGGLIPKLTMRLNSQITGAHYSAFFDDTLNLENEISLEGLK